MRTSSAAIAAKTFLVLALMFGPVTAQTGDQGVRLVNEADHLQEKALSKQDREKAVAKYEEALNIFETIEDQKAVGLVCNNLGMVLKDLGEHAKSLEYFEKSLKARRKVGDIKGEGATLNNIGTVYKDRGQYAKAVEYCQESQEIARKLGDIKGEGNALMRIGTVYQDQGQYAKAVEYYEKSLEARRKVGDIKGEGQTLNNLGIVHLYVGQYAKAVDYYEKSLERKRKVGDIKGEGNTLNNLGMVYQRWGQYGKAVEYYDKALKIYKENGFSPEEGLTVMNIGTVLVHRRDYKDALDNFETGLAIYTKIGLPTAWPKKLIGDLQLDMGYPDKAEPLLKEAGDSASLGRLHLVKSDYQGAKEYYTKLLKDAEESRNADNLFISYTGLGTTFEGLNDDPKAAEHFRKAVDLIEELRQGSSRAERETFLDVRIGGFYRTAPYEGFARVLLRLKKPLDAWKTSEYAKSRAFAEAMSKRGGVTTFEIPADVLKEDQERSDGLTALAASLRKAHEKGDRLSVEALEPQLRNQKSKFQAHIKMLREKYPLFAATKYPEPMDMKQTALKDNEWVLAYHVTDPGIIIYLTRGREIVKALFKPIPRDHLDSLVVKFKKPLEMVSGRDNFEEKLKSFDLNAGKKLSDLLLLDALENLPKHVPLLIVPDDSLGTLPFEILVLNDKGSIKTDKDLPYISGAEFFGDRNLISYCQSVTALTLARVHARSKSKEARLLAMTDPVFDEKDARTTGAPKKEAPTGPFASLCRRLALMAADKDGLMEGLKFSRLSLTGEMGKALAKMHGKNSYVCTSFDASKSNFLDKISPSLNRYDKVVFATHGYFGKDLPGIMEPVLVLTLVPPGIDGFLRMTEVMGLNMNADIVALTACQTGLGKRISGEGTMGMGRAFQYAGARSVLMSLWSVSEVASVSLVKSFFRNLKEGKSKSEALASARSEIRTRGFDHPFIWAAFILVGEVD